MRWRSCPISTTIAVTIRRHGVLQLEQQAGQRRIQGPLTTTHRQAPVLVPICDVGQDKRPGLPLLLDPLPRLADSVPKLFFGLLYEVGNDGVLGIAVDAEPKFGLLQRHERHRHHPPRSAAIMSAFRRAWPKSTPRSAARARS